MRKWFSDFVTSGFNVRRMKRMRRPMNKSGLPPFICVECGEQYDPRPEFRLGLCSYEQAVTFCGRRCFDKFARRMV